MEDHPTSESLKELGNTAIQNQKYEEAILHYTHAIKLEPTSYTLFSNRSFAFLKVQQYYLALQDANDTIRLCPSWPKGYFRKAEIEYATHQYADASASYQTALELKPDDVQLAEALNRARKQILKELKSDEVIPWLGAGIGLIIGVIIVIADLIFTNKPTHPVLMASITIIVAMVGYGIARTYRYCVKCQRSGLIQAPTDLINSENEDPSPSKTKTSTRYTKSQARQRYKNGKL